MLEGPIPESFTSLLALEILDLTDNMMTGSLPPKIGDLQNLRNLSTCEKTNSLVQFLQALGNSKSWRNIALQSNHLNGTIPTELGLLEDLEYLYLHSEQFDGEIPTELGLLTNLV